MKLNGSSKNFPKTVIKWEYQITQYKYCLWKIPSCFSVPLSQSFQKDEASRKIEDNVEQMKCKNPQRKSRDFMKSFLNNGLSETIMKARKIYLNQLKGDLWRKKKYNIKNVSKTVPCKKLLGLPVSLIHFLLQGFLKNNKKQKKIT